MIRKIRELEKRINDLEERLAAFTGLIDKMTIAADEYAAAAKIAVKTEADWNEGLANLLGFNGVPQKKKVDSEE